jgi:hypothetical protein
MAVDLSTGTEGIIEMSGGARWWCPVVEPDGDLYRVRVESGWYRHYTRDGKPAPGATYKRHVVSFVPCDYRDPRASGLPSDTTP